MHTNQAADPTNPWPPDLACRHAPGEASEDTCAYMRTIERVRAWADRAEQAHRDGRADSRHLGELWLIFAEASTAHELCPDHAALVH